MSRMHVDQGTCLLCGVCLDSCPYDALAIKDEQLLFTEECRLCQACITACPQGAISLVQEIGASQREEPAAGGGGVLVFVEQRHSRLQPVSFEMIGKGLELAQALRQPLACVLIGRQMRDQADELLWYGVDRVYCYDHPALKDYRVEPYTAAVCAVAAMMRPEIILVGATAVGRSLAPRVATRLRTGLTADCTSLHIDEQGQLVQTRPAFGGNVMASILTPHHRPQMATVRYKVMAAAQRQDRRRGEVINCKLADADLVSAVNVLETVRRTQTGSITEAEVIVAMGRGVASKQGLALVRQLARHLDGAVACSRPLVEQGLFTHMQQVGLSGRTVRPKLYIACGISGAVQHVAGMSGAETIVAINSDVNAPIFDVAHIAVVGDAYQVLPELLQLFDAKTTPADSLSEVDM
ncbi:MAG: FAD-binding protein [Limnochordia bacterium]|jgi:electron transfer flavoprotein alpha subunit